MNGWAERATGLAQRLIDGRAITDPRWAEAVRTVPRHVFVPSFVEQNDDLSEWHTLSGDDEVTRDRWADAVYSDRALVTALRPDPVFDGYRVPISSSSQPGLMARMLELLGADDGHDVVEIGTGTGYNAALLCARLGDRGVVSVDVEPELVGLARDRLAGLGWHPGLSVADAAGWAPSRPFDRLVATCGVDGVASGWLGRARPGAVLLLPLAGQLADGGLVRLVVEPDGTAHGRFVDLYAGFMPLRRRRPVQPATAAAQAPERDSRPSVIDPGLLAADQPVAMLVQHRLPGLGPRRTGVTADGAPVTTLIAVDGSWVRAEHAGHGAVVRYGGPTDLWALVEDAHAWWCHRGRPGWTRFGVSADQTGHTIWLDDPEHEIVRIRSS